MNRQAFDKYINEAYMVSADYPFESDSETAVYRHKENRKWFALVMHLPKDKFKPNAQGFVTAVNLKCDPLLIGSVILEEGIYPAYHMNKSHWISLLIDEITAEEKIKWLLDLSFELTKKK
ncbi:MAG: MmcQ/YjbR family DNA-binding protein [Ruminococcaceae bacterium]|nr:MmcQ/YjbR family DNA-binding protein [Oscillospiraceae bacterium]